MTQIFICKSFPQKFEQDVRTRNNLLCIFDSHIRSCQIWGQVQSNTFDVTQRTQNKALRIISFKQFMEPS